MSSSFLGAALGLAGRAAAFAKDCIIPPDTPLFRDGAGFFPPLGVGVPSLDEGAEDSCLMDLVCFVSGFDAGASCLTVVDDVDFGAEVTFLTGFEGAGAEA